MGPRLLPSSLLLLPSGIPVPLLLFRGEGPNEGETSEREREKRRGNHCLSLVLEVALLGEVGRVGEFWALVRVRWARRALSFTLVSYPTLSARPLARRVDERGEARHGARSAC